MRALFVFTAVSFVLLASSCKNKQGGAPDPKKEVCISDSLSRLIHIDTASISSIDDEVKLSGEISFNDNKVVKVFPFSSGQVMKVLVSMGDKVQKGQTLAIIKSADVAGNYADLSSASNDLTIAKRNMDNSESLYKNGIASEKEYVEAKETYNKAVSAAHKFQEQIEINGGGHTSADGTYIIHAPISGYVVEKKAEPGSFIRNDNAENLFTIGDISDVWVWANVYETDISRVKEGYTAKVTTLAYADTVFTGEVDKVSQVLDPVTKVMKIRVRLPNAGKQLKPEMFANMIILNKGGKRAVTIPSHAVVSDNGKNFVIVYHDRCKLELREVKILTTLADKSYVSSGISDGEKIIGENQVLLFNALKEN